MHLVPAEKATDTANLPPLGTARSLGTLHRIEMELIRPLLEAAMPRIDQYYSTRVYYGAVLGCSTRVYM